MHIENFKVLTDLVGSKSFTKAARLNGITQSAVSQQTQKLERDLKTQVINRSSTRVELTVEGKLIHYRGNEIVRTYERLMCDLEEMRHVIGGTLRVATIHSIGMHDLQELVKVFMRRYPAVRFQLEYRRPLDIYEGIAQSTVDFGLVAFASADPGVDVIKICEDQLVLIAPPEHRFSRESLPILETVMLQGERFIHLDASLPARAAIDKLFSHHRVRVITAMEVDSTELVKRAVEIGYGVAVVPESTIRDEVKHGTLRSFKMKEDGFVRPISIISKKGRVFTPAMRRFWDIALDLDARGEPKNKLRNSI